MHHRILHRDLQPPSLAGPLAVVERAEDRDRHQHAGAGVAKGRAGFDRRTVGLAGDADRAARGLRDHVKSQTLLIRAAFAKAFDLAVNDAGVQLPHDIIAEPQPLDRAGGHILRCHVGLLQHLLDDLEPAWGLQIDRHRLLVRVEHVEVIGIVVGLTGPQPAPGIAGFRIFHLDYFGAQPGEGLGTGCAGLELCEVDDANSLQ